MNNILSMTCFVIIVIVIATIVINGAGTVEEYCLEHPNATLYTSDGKEDKCIHVLNEVYFNNQLKVPVYVPK